MTSTVTCRECLRDFKRINVFHLRKHGLDERSYLEKYPGAALFSEDTLTKISKGTKEGMHRPDAWEKFQKHIATRDTTALRERFMRDCQTEQSRAKIYTPARNAKISSRKRKWWDSRRGHTIEELWGEQKGREIRTLKSEQTRGELNPAFGKVYENVGRKVGRYKGHFFRSVWEYSFLKFLENADLLKFAQYETIRIPYRWQGRSRTYTPDFLIQNILVEIKSCYVVDNVSPEDINSVKWSFAREFCSVNNLTFEVLTERDFPVVPYAVAYSDPDVEWLRI